MPATTTSRGRSQGPSGGRAGARGAGRKSPLRVVSELPPFRFDEEPCPVAGAAQLEMERPRELTAAQLRRLMISEFRDWLGTRTNRNGRPFQPDTISAYADAAIALDTWMSAEGIEADFTACDTKALNRFFAAYHAAHGQGGTNTKQRNLRHLFSWLERDHDHPHPYTEDLHRYGPARNRPSTLAGGAIRGPDRGPGRTSSGPGRGPVRYGPPAPRAHPGLAAAGAGRAGRGGRVVRLGRDRADDRVRRDPAAARDLGLAAR